MQKIKILVFSVLVLVMVLVITVYAASNGKDSDDVVEKDNTLGVFEETTIEVTTEVPATEQITESTTEAIIQETSNTEATTEEPTTPAVIISDVNETVYATMSVNVRSGYSANSSRVGALSTGDSLTRTGICDNGWSRVDYNGSVGYVNSKYLSTTVVEKPTAAPAPVATNTSSDSGNVSSGRSNQLNVGCILQNPELPSGCEVASLAIVLNYLGYGADKCDLSDNYLPKGAIGTVTAWNGFIGDPRDAHSYGCYSPVIVACANNYLSAIGASRSVVNLTGCDVSTLYAQIDSGLPVIVWATVSMKAPYYSTTWDINGESFTWLSREHCLVLTGYDENAGTVSIADPLRGNVTYDKGTFETRFRQMYSQAVVIY